MNTLPAIGVNLRQSRKRLFPKDDLNAFALRIGVSRATLQKMEKGDLSVSMKKYYSAAEVLELADAFTLLLRNEASLFDD
jgi:transcriptional regulator with XRE-family HTH domain